MKSLFYGAKGAEQNRKWGNFVSSPLFSLSLFGGQRRREMSTFASARPKMAKMGGKGDRKKKRDTPENPLASLSWAQALPRKARLSPFFWAPHFVFRFQGGKKKKKKKFCPVFFCFRPRLVPKSSVVRKSRMTKWRNLARIPPTEARRIFLRTFVTCPRHHFRIFFVLFPSTVLLPALVGVPTFVCLRLLRRRRLWRRRRRRRRRGRRKKKEEKEEK